MPNKLGIVTEDGHAVVAMSAGTGQVRIGDIIPITITSLGVTLHIDREGESYLEVEIEHDEFARVALVEIALKYDLSLDDPYYDEMQPDGRLRSYLLEVSVPS